MRCVKCQNYSHSAKTCTATHNMCAMCGQNHNCNDTHLFCMGCKMRGHSSKDSLYPTYQRKVDEVNAKHLENLMPYYPTHEPWTQALLPPQTQPRYAPPLSNSHATATANAVPPPLPLRQSTINKHFPSGPANTHQGAARNHEGHPYCHHHHQSPFTPAMSSNVV